MFIIIVSYLFVAVVIIGIILNTIALFCNRQCTIINSQHIYLLRITTGTDTICLSMLLLIMCIMQSNLLPEINPIIMNWFCKVLIFVIESANAFGIYCLVALTTIRYHHRGHLLLIIILAIIVECWIPFVEYYHRSTQMCKKSLAPGLYMPVHLIEGIIGYWLPTLIVFIVNCYPNEWTLIDRRCIRIAIIDLLLRMPTQFIKLIIMFVDERSLRALLSTSIWNAIKSTAQLGHFLQFACNIGYLTYAMRGVD